VVCYTTSGRQSTRTSATTVLAECEGASLVDVFRSSNVPDIKLTAHLQSSLYQIFHFLLDTYGFLSVTGSHQAWTNRERRDVSIMRNVSFAGRTKRRYVAVAQPAACPHTVQMLMPICSASQLSEHGPVRSAIAVLRWAFRALIINGHAEEEQA
jgi:hypothetical protein